MSVSAVDPVSRALSHVTRICFQPFDFSKWVGLGFCAFLAGLGEGGSFQFPNFWGSDSKARAQSVSHGLGQAQDWIQGHLPILVLLGLVLVLLIVGIFLLVTWLSSRGQFMVLLNVLRNRGDVVVPWRESRALGNRLFWFRFGVNLLSVLLFLLPIAGALWLAWPSLRAETMDARAMTAIFGGCGSLILLFLLVVPFYTVLNHFVVPMMWRLQCGPTEALRVFWKQLLPGHWGSLVGFVLLLLVLQIAGGMLIMMGVCLTCCLGALPVISSILFLPVTVFFRAYGLEFLAGFGPEWDLFRFAAPTPDAEPLLIP